jgi:hypothetical protein
MILVEDSFDGAIYQRRYKLTKAGDKSHNHRHTWPHSTVFCHRFRVWEQHGIDPSGAVNFKTPYTVKAGDTALIEAGNLHFFEALEDNAVYVCSHHVRRPDGTLIDRDAGLTIDEIHAIVSNLTLRDQRTSAVIAADPASFRPTGTEIAS